MSARRFNVREFVVLSLLAFGLFAAGAACEGDPNDEGGCTPSETHTCPS
jgi:hypothetical protein